MRFGISTSRGSILSQLPLLVLTLICVLVIHAVHQVSVESINDNIRKATLADIYHVIPETFNNDLFNDSIEIKVPTSLNPRGKLSIYYARQDNAVTAIAILPLMAKGYNGPIKLLAGLDTDGNITGIRVMMHSETRGFGDRVHQDSSDWLKTFSGLSLSDIPSNKWATRKDGGTIDEISGATITSRGVINAIHELLTYYEHQQDDILHKQNN